MIHLYQLNSPHRFHHPQCRIYLQFLTDWAFVDFELGTEIKCLYC